MLFFTFVRGGGHPPDRTPEPQNQFLQMFLLKASLCHFDGSKAFTGLGGVSFHTNNPLLFAEVKC